ncbi:hypothetical protein BC939DRAFT_202306 [Gamsiella multidivaricata]|uniref:uncharacterized protein n=1 Tax=Gamsiella multidivaricata TaxID=101098 RepID=UPI0022207FB2|nr:uncharacterized protein BC939DRAFT_202306 [Gamsiella multidivaricata]KAI7821722.1 hypothetical protein BC939DRAFT_202306 [Gamsiella multidivaricata]
MEPGYSSEQDDYAGSTNSNIPTAQYHPHYPKPPVLSFRSFHERHFSLFQRQAFFATAPATCLPAFGQQFNYSQHEYVGTPTPDDTVTSHSYQSTLHGNVEEEVGYTQAGLNGGESPDDVTSPVAESSWPQLSKEAIEIFEFSRRFRQQKAEAAILEQAQMKKRRIKRRKLTKLGFAAGEGDSGAEEGDEVQDGDDGAQRNGQGEDEDKDGADDQESAEEQDQVELPATDTTFMTQSARRTARLRQRLYGQDQDASATEKIQTLDVLGELLNQTYRDSLISATSNGENTSNKSKQQGRRTQVVYWPGMPLRC